MLPLSDQPLLSMPPVHAHYFQAPSSESLEHSHTLRGYTFPSNGSDHDGHVHPYQGRTSESRNHKHRFYGDTGPAIPLPGGGHYHLISGTTYRNYLKPINIVIGGEVFSEGVQYGTGGQGVHHHDYKGSTGMAIGYEDQARHGKGERHLLMPIAQRGTLLQT